MAENDCEVFVVAPREKRKNLPTELTVQNNIKILKVKIGNIIRCGMIEKGISTLMIENQYLKAINHYFKDEKFDMLLYGTPPITFLKAVQNIKRKHNCISYLILKDIFPQNAVDIGLFKKNGIIHKYFRKKEEKLYAISDYIGCMSEGNVKYILEHNPTIKKETVEVFPNSILPIEKNTNKFKNPEILKKYNIPEKAVVFLYGGSLGKPQGIDFLIGVMDDFHKVTNGYLLIVGTGTEYNKLKKHISEKNINNCALYNYLPKHEYDKLINIADVGLIFLDRRFTIPNFPSRLTAYMENSMPILAATDKVTDVKDVIVNSGSGLWSESGDLESFISNANAIASDKELRTKMGENSRKYLEENYDVRKCVDTIISKLT